MDNGKITLMPGEALTVEAGYTVPVLSGGLPFIDRVVMAIKNTDKAWYEATRRYGSWDGGLHPNKCEDWNLESGGNTDLGEPLVSPFNGLVIAAGQYGGGIGKVIQILGLYPAGDMVMWAGRHLHEVLVSPGQVVQCGQDIGSIGNADGKYSGAHLHEQIMTVGEGGIPSPTAYASDRRYTWQQPSAWYVAAGVDAELVARMAAWDGA